MTKLKMDCGEYIIKFMILHNLLNHIQVASYGFKKQKVQISLIFFKHFI
jgi:hypothetical protein